MKKLIIFAAILLSASFSNAMDTTCEKDITSKIVLSGIINLKMEIKSQFTDHAIQKVREILEQGSFCAQENMFKDAGKYAYSLLLCKQLEQEVLAGGLIINDPKKQFVFDIALKNYGSLFNDNNTKYPDQSCHLKNLIN